jgi:secreted Zn-dependent insulinase-like peptidase
MQVGKDAEHPDSAVAIYLEMGEQSHELDARLQLLCQILDKEAYSQLRTREQLVLMLNRTLYI